MPTITTTPRSDWLFTSKIFGLLLELQKIDWNMEFMSAERECRNLEVGVFRFRYHCSLYVRGGRLYRIQRGCEALWSEIRKEFR